MPIKINSFFNLNRADAKYSGWHIQYYVINVWINGTDYSVSLLIIVNIVCMFVFPL